jgi:hypothetical protein
MLGHAKATMPSRQADLDQKSVCRKSQNKRSFRRSRRWVANNWNNLNGAAAPGQLRPTSTWGASDARPIVAITRSANEAAVLHGSGQHDAAGVVRLRPAVPAIRPTPTSKSLTTPAAPATRNGGNRVGPHLRDIFGRKAGSLPGYRYSDAMKSVDFAWDEEKLCASLKIRMRRCRATA